MHTIDIMYQGDLRCRVVHVASGAVLETEPPTDNGGKGGAFCPTDLVAVAVGTCVLTVAAMRIEGTEEALAGCRLQVTKEMSSSPRRISRIRLELVLRAPVQASFAEELERLVRRVPVSASLGAEVEITLVVTPIAGPAERPHACQT